jgi:hypothetical protein
MRRKKRYQGGIVAAWRCAIEFISFCKALCNVGNNIPIGLYKKRRKETAQKAAKARWKEIIP